MTPDPATLGPLVERYGLPLVLFGIFLVLLLTRRLVTGSELERKQALLEREVAYRDQLRLEERARGDRLEIALRDQIASTRDVTESLKDIERELGRRLDDGAPRRRA